MKKEEEEYYNRKYTQEQKIGIFLAIEYAAKAAGAPFAKDVDSHVYRSLRYLTEFVNSVKSAPKHCEKTAAASRAIHTYLRKCSDDSITTLLYKLVSNDTGNGVWYMLCKSIVENINNKNLNAHDFIKDVEAYFYNNQELPENEIMFYAIKSWWEQNENADFMQMIKEFKKNNWLENS